MEEWLWGCEVQEAAPAGDAEGRRMVTVTWAAAAPGGEDSEGEGADSSSDTVELFALQMHLTA